MKENAYRHTKYFVEECGERVAGTAAVLKASDYILDFYQRNGIASETFDFQVPVCSVRRSLLQVKKMGRWEDVPHTPALFCGQTPQQGMELALVYVEDGSVANLRQVDVKGKAVLICRDVYMEYPDIDMYRRLAEYGAAAVLYTTSDGHWDLPYVYANYETMEEAFTIPTAVIHYRTALRLLQEGVEEIRLAIRFDVESGATRNTIAVVAGRDRADETIVVCAHLDSALSSRGATDDVAGVAMIMELAKYYHELAKAGGGPRRTLRFIAWSGHECGLHGSKKYLLGNPAVRRSTRFVLNYDIVGNLLCNYAIVGGFSPAVEAEINGLVRSLKLDWPVTAAPMVVDTLSFAADQIPHLTLTAGFCCGNHTKYDGLELIAPRGFENPVRFSRAVIDWAANAETVEQGYPQELYTAMRAEGKRYGWGLFDE